MRKLPKELLLIFALSMTAFFAFGQNSLKRKADIQFNLKAYDLAIESYQKYLNTNNEDIAAMAKLAESYARSNDLLSAAKWYERITSDSRHSTYHDIQFGKLLMKLGLYDRAEKQFQKISNQNPAVAKQYVNSCAFARNILALGDKYIISQTRFSGAYDDFAPELKNDDLIYASYNSGNNSSLIQRNQNLLYIYDLSQKKNSVFNAGMMNMSGIGPVHFSPSGQYVVYTRNSFKNGILQVSGDEKDMSIYIAEVDDNGQFINEKPLPFNGMAYSCAFACFGENDNTIFYSSNKNGRNFDIYQSKKIDGKWSEGKALDKKINTFGNEITPYFVDGKLYFSSDYLNGLGGYDVFKTTEYKGQWSFPVNLGKGVNSPEDDLYFVKKEAVDLAYFTSNRLGSKGGYDIYSAVPATDISNDDLVYEYIPEAVKLDNLKDKGTAPVSITDSKYVSYAKDDGMSEVSLEGAKLIAYDDVILSPSRVYFIQLASLSRSRVNVKMFKKLTKYGNVYKVKKGRVTKVRLGYFVSVDEAKAVLSSVKRQGYRDAFIVEDLLNSSELELLASSYTFGNNKKYEKPSETGDYKIKLAAYSNPLYFDVNKVKDLGVIEQWSKGKWTIFILSGYRNFEDAQKALLKAKNRGFSTAELVIDDNGIITKVKKN